VSYYYSDASPQDTPVEVAAKCQVVITHKEQLPTGWLANQMYAFPELGKPATEAVQRWVSQNSNYKLVQEYLYVFATDFPKDLKLSQPSILTIQVYRRQKSS